LPPEGQDRVYRVLRRVATDREDQIVGGGHDAWRAPSKSQKTTVPTRRKRRRITSSPSQPKQSPMSPSAAHQQTRNKVVLAPAPSECALCHATLSDLERRYSVSRRDLFLGHGYCSEHATKVEAVLAVEVEG
jgi:hypothetical protein